MSWPNVSCFVFTYMDTAKVAGQVKSGQIFTYWVLFPLSQFKKGVVSTRTGEDFVEAVGGTFGFKATDAISVSFSNPGGNVVIDNSSVKSLPGTPAAPNIYDQLSGKRMPGTGTVQWEGQSVNQYGNQDILKGRLNRSDLCLAQLMLRQSAKIPYQITVGEQPSVGKDIQWPNIYGARFRGLMSVYGKVQMNSPFWHNRWKCGIVGSSSMYIISKWVTLSGRALPTAADPPRVAPQPKPVPPPAPPPPPPPPAPPPPDPPATFNPEPPADAASKYMGLKCPIVLPEVNGISSQTTDKVKQKAFNKRGQ